MITPKEAYDLFKKEFPRTEAETITDDYGSGYYIISNCIEGDMVDDSYAIDKNTGRIHQITLLNADDYISDYDEDDPSTMKWKTYRIKDL